MFKIKRKIKFGDLVGENIKDLETWTDAKFQLNVEFNGEVHDKFDYKDRASLDEYGRRMKENCPSSLGLSLFYLRNHTYYHQVNHTGRYCLYHVWPLFFEKFPLGQIWIIENPRSWNESVWEGIIEIAKIYNNKNNTYGFYHQEMTGLQTDSFPFNALNILSYGIYPLILSNFTASISTVNLTFLYIPDRGFKHSQMTEADTLYNQILCDVQHIFDDQWTFDGSRGPKSASNEIILNPIKQLDYFEWFIEKINDRMSDILLIDDFLLREKLVMTINRAIFDAHLSVTSELPYISKVFFFNFLDKLANIMTILNNNPNDTGEWKKLIDEDFLCKTVRETIKKIPNMAGKHLNDILDFAVKEMKFGDLNPEYLRDLRNTNHGYNVNQKSILRLMKHDGEINNDIPLLATILLLYIFSIKWEIAAE